ncbi:MAG: hypothetical protein C4K58_06530 [Flavobacteriaceae bacterium]|nr:MAG: hypothetical protein C4K58_06530 [Flavobacteriaceae bacterium]
MQNKVSIPSPCHYGWENMNPNEKGRFCDSCQKTVVDFSTMSTVEIQNTISELGTQKTCGHFKTIDTDVQLGFVQKQLLLMHNWVDTKVKQNFFRTVALFAIGSLLTLSGCDSTTEGEIAPQKMEDSIKAKPSNTPKSLSDSISLKK